MVVTVVMVVVVVAAAAVVRSALSRPVVFELRGFVFGLAKI